jgi:hypothetical protein
MQGRRVDTVKELYAGEPGVYCLVTNIDTDSKVLWIKDPAGHVGRVSKHTITEHEDGTISVEPSILATTADHGHDWHGYLRRGVWSEA